MDAKELESKLEDLKICGAGLFLQGDFEGVQSVLETTKRYESELYKLNKNK